MNSPAKGEIKTKIPHIREMGLKMRRGNYSRYTCLKVVSQIENNALRDIISCSRTERLEVFSCKMIYSDDMSKHDEACAPHHSHPVYAIFKVRKVFSFVFFFTF